MVQSTESGIRKVASQERTVTPQYRTGISLLTSTQFEPDIWVVVDGGHPDPIDSIGSGAGVVVLQRIAEDGENLGHSFEIHWQHVGYPLPHCPNSTDAEIWAAVKGLEQVTEFSGKKNICLVSDSSAVGALHRKLLVIELEAKYAERYAREMTLSPLKDLADLYLQSQPCQIVSRQSLAPEGFNVVLLGAHQSAHELATKAALNIRQFTVGSISEPNMQIS